MCQVCLWSFHPQSRTYPVNYGLFGVPQYLKAPLYKEGPEGAYDDRQAL